MHLLAVNGAPRKGGFTTELLDLFCRGAANAGASVNMVSLADRTINPCLGCYECYRASHLGSCIQSDNMADLIDQFLSANGIVLASPVYFFGYSALLKSFLERLLPITRPNLTVEPDGLVHNALADPLRGPKRAVTITTCAHRDPTTLNGLIDTLRKACMGFGAEMVGKLVRPESHFLDFPASKPLTLRKIKGAFESAGREFVLHQQVSSETEQQAAMPLSRDEKVFKERFSAYWQILHEQNASGGDRQQSRETVAEDLRILMPELAACFEPSAANDLEAVIQFELTGRPAQNWIFKVADGKCEASTGQNGQPTLTIRTTTELMVDIIMQRVDLRQAIVRREIQVHGNRALMLKFGRLFPPPSV